MKIHWNVSLKSIPELADLPAEERKKLWQKYCLDGLFQWKTGIAFFVYIFVLNWGIDYISDEIYQIKRIISAFIVGMGSGLGWYFLSLVGIHNMRKDLQRTKNSEFQRTKQ